MRVYEYINDGGAFFDNTLSYPTSINTTVRENVTNTIKYRFAFHKMRKTLEGMASDYNVELTTLVPSIIHSVMVANDYKYNTLYSTLNLDYNPIENYRMSETETIDRDVTTTDSGTTSGTRGNTTTNNLTDTETLNLSDAETVNLENKLTLNTTNTTTPNIQDTTTDVKTTSDETTVTNTGITDVETRKGFNSNEWEGDTKHEVDSSGTTTADVTENDTLTFRHTGTESVEARGTETTANTGTDTTLRTGTDTTTHTGTVQDSETTSGTHASNGSESEDVSRTLTRYGNIGVTTSQQMLESEREVALFSFIDIVTADIIKEICINVT